MKVRSGESDEMYSAIDAAFAKLERQLKRLDSKLNDHWANKEEFVASLVEESEESEESSGGVGGR